MLPCVLLFSQLLSSISYRYSSSTHLYFPACSRSSRPLCLPPFVVSCEDKEISHVISLWVTLALLGNNDVICFLVLFPLSLRSFIFSSAFLAIILCLSSCLLSRFYSGDCDDTAVEKATNSA